MLRNYGLQLLREHKYFVLGLLILHFKHIRTPAHAFHQIFEGYIHAALLLRSSQADRLAKVVTDILAMRQTLQ
jgi:hypothetical protein